MSNRIAFIGGGNMARSLIGGLMASGFEADSIRVAEPLAEQRDALHNEFGVHTGTDNAAAVMASDVVVLAVKPQVLRDVASALSDAVRESRPLLVSIAAGVRETDLRAWVGGEAAIVRCMPNTPALLQCGATALYANDLVSPAQRTAADEIMRAAGVTVWVDEESALDAVTAVSGSGPAYFFLVMEAMEQAGVELGLDAETARLLTLQTALGAARMALESGESPATLRERVTSPGGTTERAIGILKQGGLEAVFAEALKGASTRCRELSDLLGGNA